MAKLSCVELGIRETRHLVVMMDTPDAAVECVERRYPESPRAATVQGVCEAAPVVVDWPTSAVAIPNKNLRIFLKNLRIFLRNRSCFSGLLRSLLSDTVNRISTIREVIEAQQERLHSADARERAAAFLRCGELATRLQGLTDRQIGQLMFDIVWGRLPLTSPEMSITVDATERLFRSRAGARLDYEVFNEPGTLPLCSHCGEEMMHYIGIDEPDFRKCVSLKCGYKAEERND